MKKLANLLKLTLAVAALVVVSTGLSFAQDFTGTWQGPLVLPTGPQIRIVFKISAAGAGALSAVMYSIDQTPQPIAGAVTVQGATITVSVAAMNGKFEGRLSADGKTIAGTLTQGVGPAVALNLAKATADTAWAIPPAPAPMRPMAADANPSFEVATIKPSKPDALGFGIIFRNQQLATLNTTLTDLLAFAYGLHAKQITGGPAWMEQDKYDLVGKPEGQGQPSDKQLRTMIQKLVADRFNLTFHRDKKELSAYAITAIDKTGAKLTKSAGDPNGLPGVGFSKPGALIAVNATIADFAGVLQSMVLDRPVVDQAGLSGRFDFKFNWTPDQSQFRGQVTAPVDDPSAPPGLFTAIQEQLGLKLDSTKSPVDVIVIDHVEKPSAD
jgi:uncharacterized protein (TIGR03435 family)